MSHSIPPRLFEVAVRAQGDAVCITDGDLDAPGPRILFVNDSFTDLTGYAAEAAIGKSPRILQGPLTDARVTAALRRTVAAGERFEGETVNYRADGTPFVMHWTIDPVIDAGATPSHFVAVQRDVTALRQLERLRIAERSLANAAIAIADGQEFDDAVVNGTMRILTAATQLLYTGRPHVVTRVSGEWTIVPDADAERRRRLIDLTRRHRRPTELREDSKVTFIAPFDERDAVGGIIVDAIDPAAAELVSLDHLSDLSHTAGRGLSALAGIAQRRREALAVQRVLLPAGDVVLEGFTAFAHYTPSRRTERAGGDWYDAVGDEAGVRIVVGDAAGKGLRAAAEMGLVRAHIHALLTARAPLDVVAHEADRFCREEAIMATAAFADIDRATGIVSAISAGHPPPLLTDATTTRFIPVSPIAPLGAFRHPGPAARPFVETMGDATLVLYTDGVLNERHAGLDAALERLRLTVATGGSSVQAAGSAVVASAGAHRDDDVAVFAIAQTSP